MAEEVTKKKNKHNLTALDEQQAKLDKLFEKIDKPVYIPDKPKEKLNFSTPKDFVRNVSGSSAGAGSGDFHVYRAQRRREYARMKSMDDQEKKELDERDYSDKLALLRARDEERTAKKRAKRQKRNKKEDKNQEKKQEKDQKVE
ncbi:DUF1168-domain-containing protein [Backusella circina FSU 941]|nr:DUF1168-domain-containing protein [Backusella circina FSU 941]